MNPCVSPQSLPVIGASSCFTSGACNLATEALIGRREPRKPTWAPGHGAALNAGSGRAHSIRVPVLQRFLKRNELYSDADDCDSPADLGFQAEVSLPESPLIVPKLHEPAN